MTIEEMARKLCEHNYIKLCDGTPGKNAAYSLEAYWERNKKYFIEQVEIYLEVKKSLEAK